MDVGNIPAPVTAPAKRPRFAGLRRALSDPFAIAGASIYLVFVIAGIAAGWLAQ